MLRSAKIWWFSAAGGAVFGVLFRAAFGMHLPGSAAQSATLVLSLSYLALVPGVMGFFAVLQYLRKTPEEAVRWYKWLFLPWASVGITILVFMATAWEGAICILMAAPIVLVFSMIGGAIARAFYESPPAKPTTVFGAAALPLLMALIEIHVPNPYEIRTVNTEIMIHAPASMVWKNIERVRAINARELPESWVNRIGFPRPVEATLSHEGVGGVRHASFTGGLVFAETVNDWQQEKDLRFSIRANTDSILTTTLDEHVTIGGPYFDVLEGEYQLEPRPDGVLLHLSSHERLSTHLNGYAGLWTDAAMRAIQEQILPG